MEIGPQLDSSPREQHSEKGLVTKQDKKERLDWRYVTKEIGK